MRAIVKVFLGGGPLGTEPVSPGVYEEPFPFLLEKEVAHMMRIGVTESDIVDISIDAPKSAEEPAVDEAAEEVVDEEPVDEGVEEAPVVRKASK